MLRIQVILLLLTAAVFGPRRFVLVYSHQETEDWVCDLANPIRVQARFRPGIITLDGKIDDWKDVDGYGSNFPLLPALDPDADKEYKGGKMTVKAVHDGKEAYFMLQVNGNYAYTQGDGKKCPSVSLMFQIGENASYHRMGGCEQGPDACTSKTCHGHEVDIMHFLLGDAIPGRLYGGNLVDNLEGYGGDRFGHLVDVYAWNPHCKFLDGVGPLGNDTSAQNDWHGLWWHSSLNDHPGFLNEDSPYGSKGQQGTYYFEFSRPLTTMDRLRQDAQFTIGQSTKLSAAFWYPMEEEPWHGSAHYSIGCDWIVVEFIPGNSGLAKAAQSRPGTAATAFSLLFSTVAFCISIFLAYRISQDSRTTTKFIPMETL